MTSVFVGLYGLYLILVGINGNASSLSGMLSEDAPKYLPWLLAIVAISILTEFESTEKLVKPFIALLVLNFFLRNFNTIKQQTTTIYSSALH